MGKVYVYEGGGVEDLTVNSGGSAYVYSSGVVNSVTLNSWGSMYISSGGTADNVSVNSIGYIYVSSGGTCLNLVLTSKARYVFQIAPGTLVSGTHDGSKIFISNNSAGSFQASQWCNIEVFSGCSVEEILVRNTMFGATYTFHNGAIINSLVIVNDQITFNIQEGSVISNLIVSGAGNDPSFSIKNGMTIFHTYITKDATLNIKSGASISNVSGSTCYIYISSCGYLNNATLYYSGRIQIYSGGTVNDATVYSGGRMIISRGNSEQCYREQLWIHGYIPEVLRTMLL